MYNAVASLPYIFLTFSLASWHHELLPGSAAGAAALKSFNRENDSIHPWI